MEYAVAAAILAVLGFAVWLAVRAFKAGEAKVRLAQMKADQEARSKYDAAVEDWNADGGLAGGMRDPE